jgi:hypothetical protein
VREREGVEGKVRERAMGRETALVKEASEQAGAEGAIAEHVGIAGCGSQGSGGGH